MRCDLDLLKYGSIQNEKLHEVKSATGSCSPSLRGGLTLFQNINHCLGEFLTVTLSPSWMIIDNDIEG